VESESKDFPHIQSQASSVQILRESEERVMGLREETIKTNHVSLSKWDIKKWNAPLSQSPKDGKAIRSCLLEESGDQLQPEVMRANSKLSYGILSACIQ
jgi:hypothetical protein